MIEADRDGRLAAIQFFMVAFATLGAPFVVFHSAGTALFLTHHGAEGLPAMYVVFAVTAAIAAWAFTWGRKHVPLRTLLFWLIVGRIVISVPMAAGFEFGAPKTLSFIIAVWARLDYLIGGLAFWAYAEQFFSVRNAKRWFVVLAAGDAFGLMLNGLLAPQILLLISVEHMLFMVPMMLLLAVPPALAIGIAPRAPADRAHAAPEVASQQRRSKAKRGRSLARGAERYAMALSSFAIIWALGHYALDIVFLGAAAQAFETAAPLTGLIGYALAFAGLISLALLAVGQNRLLEKHGPRTAIIGMPALMLGMAVLVVLLSTFGELGYWILFVIAAIKAIERALIAGFYSPAFSALYQPLPEMHRRPFRELAEKYARPAGFALAGVLLAIWIDAYGFDVLNGVYIYCGFILVWLAGGWVVSNIHAKAMDRAVSSGQTFDAGAVGAADRESREMLAQKVLHGEPDEAVEAARLQAVLDPDGFLNTAPRLIAHGSPEVLKRLLTSVKEITRFKLFPPMAGRLTVEEDKELRDALLIAAAATGHRNSPRLLAKTLAAEPENPPMGALIGLGLHGGPYGASVAGQFLETYSTRGVAELIETLAAILKIGSNAPTGPIAQGLRSTDQRTRNLAIRAAGKVSDAGLANLLIDCLANGREARAARQSLSLIGEPAVGPLAQAIGNRNYTLSQRRTAVAALGGIDSPEAEAHLLRHISSTNVDLKASVHLALWRAGSVAPKEMKADVKAQAEEMMRNGLAAAMARCDLAAHSTDPEQFAAMDRALAARSMRSARRAYRAVRLLKPRNSEEANTITSVRASNMRNAPSKLLSHARMVEDPFASDVKAKLQTELGYTEQKPDEWLAHIITEATWRTDLLQAMALWHLALFAPDRITQVIETIEDPGPLLSDMIAYIDAAGEGKTDMTLSIIEKVLTLKAADLFRDVPDEDLADIAPYLTSLYFDPGEAVMKKGDQGDELYIVASGAVQVRRSDGETVDLGAKAVFGDLAALDPEPRMADVIAVEATHVLALSNEQLSTLFEANAEIASGVIAALVRRLRQAEKY
ncbi:MAG: cyclic nucleotide-binding domain-containing protein [Pikeienuella sp.]